MSIEINNESGLPVDAEAVVAQARFQLKELRIHPAAELSVLFVDEAAMAALHMQWMDEPGPTDVLSFPMDELREPGADEEPTEGLLGDIVICPQVAARQAAEQGHSRDREMSMLLTHGLLHLLGHDHAEPDEHARMFGLQDRLLTAWVQHRDAGGQGRL